MHELIKINTILEQLGLITDLLPLINITTSLNYKLGAVSYRKSFNLSPSELNITTAMN